MSGADDVLIRLAKVEALLDRVADLSMPPELDSIDEAGRDMAETLTSGLVAHNGMMIEIVTTPWPAGGGKPPVWITALVVDDWLEQTWHYATFGGARRGHHLIVDALGLHGNSEKPHTHHIA